MRTFSLLETMVAAAILVLGVLGALATQQQASHYSSEAELRGQLELLAQSALEEALQLPLGGPTGLYAVSAAPTHGAIVTGADMPGQPDNPFPANLVAVVRCEGNPAQVNQVDTDYLVDLQAAGLPASEVVCARIHVEAFVAVNPGVTDASALVARTGAGMPRPVHLFAYRLVD